MSRLFRCLEFADYNEVKERVRSLRSSGVPLAAQDADGGLPLHLALEQQNFRQLFEDSDKARIQDVTRLLAEARNILLLGFRNSFPVALHLRQQLLQCRSGVALAPQPGQSVGDELAGLGEGDVVVLLGFRHRPAGLHNTLKASAATGTSTILIADSSARWLAADASRWIECPVEGSGTFDSYATAMSLMSVLANGVLVVRDRSGRDRIREITGIYDSLREIEQR